MKLSDEQIQDLLRVGNPTDEECRLIRMGWDAAMRERAAMSVPDISDDMIEAIESRAEQSYRRHFSGCRGQQATPADDISWHVIHATREVLVEAMEAKP